MRVAAWLVFVAGFVVGPLLYALWLQRPPIGEVDALPETRGRQRPAPDAVEARDLLVARLRLVAAVAALIAAVWLVGLLG